MKSKPRDRGLRSLACLMAVWAAGGVVANKPIAAHHSAAMFDDSKCRSIEGTVRNFQWQYPHSWLWIVVANGTAAGDIWGFEMPAPSNLLRLSNWSRELLAKGTQVTVKFGPLRDGRNGGLANTIVLSNGTALHAAPNAVACEKEFWRKGADGSSQFVAPK